ncbi:tetratricopeptide repeat protein [Zunongwangia sp. SCSIO 43204]|uniref:tetratricopeptide repeat protein n=1 Tax=Zunongwangia sp. SCSIO 43204 TaxID=2779359 RepID=UPI001CA94F01|nr:tetratricopeptide repeat protein [Zunongwangia sp. SCSIO 43204]UAB84664.1 tetratricopeptide repeat protein [Zunongwangia sp. SCSIO 43204]
MKFQLEQNNYTVALEILEQNHSDSEFGKLYLGDINSHLKHWDEAISYYEKLVELHPNSALYNFKMGGAMGMKAMEINKFQAAFLIPDIKKYLEKAVALDPEHIESRRALAQLYLELPSVLGGGLDKSLAHTKKLEELNELDYRIAMAAIYAYKDKEEISGEMIKKAIEKSQAKPSLILRNYMYFELAQEAVRYQVAASEIDRLMKKYISGFNYLDLKTPAEAYLKLAQLSEKRGNKKAATKYISKSLDYDAKAEIALELQEDIQDM